MIVAVAPPVMLLTGSTSSCEAAGSMIYVKVAEKSPVGWRAVSEAGWLTQDQRMFIKDWLEKNTAPLGVSHDDYVGRINGGMVWFEDMDDAMLFYLKFAQ